MFFGGPGLILCLREPTRLRSPVAKYTTKNAKMNIKTRKPAMSPKVTQSVSFSSLNMLLVVDDDGVEEVICCDECMPKRLR